jgi:hypothetical protein
MVSVLASAYALPEVCVGHDMHFRLDPDEIRSDTFSFVGPNAWNHLTGEPAGAIEGRFRLVYKVFACAQPSECRPAIPDSLTSSSLFGVGIQE